MWNFRTHKWETQKELRDKNRMYHLLAARGKCLSSISNIKNLLKASKLRITGLLFEALKIIFIFM